MTCYHLTIPALQPKDIDRFFTHVSPQLDGCWYWTAHLDKDGYGGFKLRGKTYRAHRVSYLIHFGIDPANKKVLHRCDNPPCVRPHSLFLGTTRDNVLDKYHKGRQSNAWNLPENKARGSRVNTSKLSESQAKDVIKRLNRGEGLTFIGKIYGISKQSVRAIKMGDNWKHLPR